MSTSDFQQAIKSIPSYITEVSVEAYKYVSVTSTGQGHIVGNGYQAEFILQEEEDFESLRSFMVKNDWEVFDGFDDYADSGFLEYSFGATRKA